MDRRARMLATEPFEVARELERSKHGTLLLISRWHSLGEAVASNQALDAEQVQLAYDLLAVPKVLRNGSTKVPAANDAPALMALVKRELARHQANLEQTLNRRDASDREAARLGIVKDYDKATKNLRSDAARAQRRLKWAQETYQQLRQGVDPATLIDNETRKPINPDAHAASAPEPASPAPSSPPPTTPPPPESPPESPQAPLPDGCAEEDAEMLHIVAELIDARRRSPGAAQPPTHVPGPPLA